MTAVELKQKLLNTNIFNDNEYMDMYIHLIMKNWTQDKLRGVTQRHHIIPACYFRENHIKVDNSKDNMVNLHFCDHLKAHALLCLFSKESSSYRYKMFVALCKIEGSTHIYDKETILNIFHKSNEYQKAYEISRAQALIHNPMNNQDIRCRHDRTMRSPSVRCRISNTQRDNVKNNVLFNDQHRLNLKKACRNRKSSNGNNISKKGYVGGVTGLRMLYKPDGYRTYVKPEYVDTLLNLGYTLPVKKTDMDKSCTIITHQKHTYTRQMDKDLVHKHLSDSHHRPETEQKGSKWMNDGTKNHFVHPNKIQSAIEKGWKFGQLKK